MKYIKLTVIDTHKGNCPVAYVALPKSTSQEGIQRLVSNWEGDRYHVLQELTNATPTPEQGNDHAKR